MRNNDNFEDRYNEEHKEEVEELYNNYKIIIKRDAGIDLTQNVKVLEVGSGSGVLLDCMRRDGVNAVGLDARPRGSKESLQRVSSNSCSNRTNAFCRRHI